MKIEPVENFEGLFYLIDVYDINLLNKFIEEDFNSIPHKSLNLQEKMNLRESRQEFPKEHIWYKLIKSFEYKFFNNLGYQINGSVFWLDKKGFFMPLHEDNEKVVAAMQVYLNDGNEKHGTTFVKDNKKITIPYKKNHGYFMINKKIKHGLIERASSDRYSIYNWFDKIEV